MLLHALLLTALSVSDVTQFGAVGDGVALNTTSIQAAIDAAAAAGGGEVTFPPGKFVTGTIYLKSGVHLRLSQGTTILGSTNLADYPLNRCAYPSRSDSYTLRALIWGEGLSDISITGLGTIDGQGAAFRGVQATPEEVAAAGQSYEQEGRYVPDKVYLNRPYLIRLISCRNVKVEDLNLRNSAMWMQHYLDCDFLTLRGLNVYNHVAANNDMIDIDGCRDVVVSDCVGDTDDDALTLKSTGAKPTERVVITNCLLRSHCNAIKAGTESAGGFKDIAISNCVIQRSSVKEAPSGRPEGLAGIALELVDGGTLERVTISNIVIQGTTAPIFMRLGNRGKTAKPSDPKPEAGVFRNVSISNVIATGASAVGCAFSGIPGHYIENISLSNIHISFVGGGSRVTTPVPEVEDKYPDPPMFGQLPAYGFYFRHVRNVRLRDIDLTTESPDARPAIVAEDAENLEQ
ncbi:MAG: glycosyl hydrolase family 28 protein [FCB group bacterium]|jgi:polygalacturonase|nr:glycosyl hydrolase family 28 protein [FCB group bacterium]